MLFLLDKWKKTIVKHFETVIPFGKKWDYPCGHPAKFPWPFEEFLRARHWKASPPSCIAEHFLFTVKTCNTKFVKIPTRKGNWSSFCHWKSHPNSALMKVSVEDFGEMCGKVVKLSNLLRVLRHLSEKMWLMAYFDLQRAITRKFFLENIFQVAYEVFSLWFSWKIVSKWAFGAIKLRNKGERGIFCKGLVGKNHWIGS